MKKFLEPEIELIDFSVEAITGEPPVLGNSDDFFPDPEI